VIGEVLHYRYELESRLGSGPLFTTFLGGDRLRHRQVVLKLLRPEFSALPEIRLAVKAHTDAAQRHRWKGTPQVLGLDEHDGRLFLISERASGTALGERIKRLAPMAVPLAVDTAIGIAEVLDQAHKNGVVHGGLRPSNVIVSLEGTVSVTDFGLRSVALAHADAMKAVLEDAGPYDAPELFAGGDPSPASDLYALGVILFEMLTGERPFPALSPQALGEELSSTPVPPMRVLNPAVPGALQELVEKLTAKAPSFRYRSAEALLLDLKGIRDSLRFGRPLEWSLKPSGTGERPRAAAPPPAQAKEKPGPTGKPPPARRPEPREAPDIPRWWTLLNLSLTILVILVVLVFAAWTFLSWTKPPEVRVPALIGKTTAEARALLRDRDLKLNVARQQINEHYPPETIYEMSPAAGSRVRKGSTVSVGVSLGLRTFPMPELHGLTEVQARNLLMSEGIESLVVSSREHDEDVRAGRVIRQAPSAGINVDATQRVQVVLSLGPPPESEPVPDLGLEPAPPVPAPSRWTLPIEVPASSAESVLVRVEFRDDTGPRTVYEGYRRPGDDFTLTVHGHGEQATVSVYVDGRRAVVMVLSADP
jgi:hypothetical protein